MHPPRLGERRGGSSPRPTKRVPRHEHHRPSLHVERFHDVRLVRTLEVRPRLAALGGDPGFLGDCAARILPGGAANRLGYAHYSGFQLKIIQEVITLSVFMGFAVLFLKEKLAWNYLVAFVFLGGAAFFAFAFKAPGPTN